MNSLTAKEELQSLNEELTALNGQLKEALSRQRSTSNNLKNVLYSTDVATLFLDADLNIRFFTPAIQALFRIIPGDIGRPLSDLNALAGDSGLPEDARTVLGQSAAIERDIQIPGGVWFRRRILPYFSDDHLVEGIVITFTDITEIRKVTGAQEAAKRQSELATIAKSRFLAAASHDLRSCFRGFSSVRRNQTRPDTFSAAWTETSSRWQACSIRCSTSSRSNTAS